MDESTKGLLGWNQLKSTLRLLASEPDVQLKAYPDFVPPATELVEEFDDWFLIVREGARSEITSEQWESLLRIEGLFEHLQRDGVHLPEEGLRTDPTWGRIREAAARALAAFGWTPGDHRDVDLEALSKGPVGE